jgi:hypothetical protein
MGIALIVVLSGCKIGNTEESIGSASDSVVGETIIYKGVVKVGVEPKENSLYLSSLEAIGKSLTYGEVILLMEGVVVEDQETGKAIEVEALKSGDEIEVELEKDAPITRSIPAQIAGSGIVKLARVK